MASDTYATCSQCNVYRGVVEIMGGKYFVFGTCGHVEPIFKEGKK